MAPNSLASFRASHLQIKEFSTMYITHMYVYVYVYVDMDMDMGMDIWYTHLYIYMYTFTYGTHGRLKLYFGLVQRRKDLVTIDPFHYS